MYYLNFESIDYSCQKSKIDDMTVALATSFFLDNVTKD